MPFLSLPDYLDRYAGLQAVDIRSAFLYEQGRLPHAVSLPFSINPEQLRWALSDWRGRRLPDPERLMEKFPLADLSAIRRAHSSRELLLYDADGGLAAQVLDRMLDRRYYFLSGGFSQFRTYQTHFFSWPRSIYLLTGETGCGKTRVLRALQALGAAVVDLETLAGHRGSVFGAGAPGLQPSPQDFHNRLWETFRAVDPAQPVFLEQKGPYIGHCALPAGLWEQMKTARTIRLTASASFRIHRLTSDYAHLGEEDLLAGLNKLKSSLTASLYTDCRRAIEEGDREGFVSLLLAYYDQSPGYQVFQGKAWREVSSETEDAKALGRRILDWVEDARSE